MRAAHGGATRIVLIMTGISVLAGAVRVAVWAGRPRLTRYLELVGEEERSDRVDGEPLGVSHRCVRRVLARRAPSVVRSSGVH